MTKKFELEVKTGDIGLIAGSLTREINDYLKKYNSVLALTAPGGAIKKWYLDSAKSLYSLVIQIYTRYLEMDIDDAHADLDSRLDSTLLHYLKDKEVK